MIDRIKDFFLRLDEHHRYIYLGVFLLQALLLSVFFIRFGVIIAEGSDTHTYVEPAQNLLATGHLNNADGSPTFFRTPGYIWFLALVYLIAGTGDRGNAIVVILQMIMLLGSNYMIYSTVKKRFCGIAGVFAALLFTVDVNNYYYTLTIMTDAFFGFLLVGACFLFNEYTLNKKVSRLMASLILICYSLLTRPQIMYMTLVYLVILVIVSIRKIVPWKVLILYAVLLVSIFGGWKYRNYILFGVSDYNQVRAKDQLDFYSPIVYADINGGTIEEARDIFMEQVYAEYPDFDTFSVQEEVRIKNEIGSAYISEHVGTYIKCNFKGLFTEMVAPGVTWIESWNVGGAALSVIKLAVAASLLFTYLLYATGFLANLKRLEGVDWIVFLTAAYLMASTAIVGYSRFRIPFYPLCLIGGFISLRLFRLKTGPDGPAD